MQTPVPSVVAAQTHRLAPLPQRVKLLQLAPAQAGFKGMAARALGGVQDGAGKMMRRGLRCTVTLAVTVLVVIVVLRSCQIKLARASEERGESKGPWDGIREYSFRLRYGAREG
jgi:hypothetical protein